MSNNAEHLSYKGGCSVMFIEVFKRRPGLGFR